MGLLASHGRCIGFGSQNLKCGQKQIGLTRQRRWVTNSLYPWFTRADLNQRTTMPSTLVLAILVLVLVLAVAVFLFTLQAITWTVILTVVILALGLAAISFFISTKARQN